MADVVIIWLAPGLAIEGAVGSVRDVVFTQEVGIKEDNFVVGAISTRVSAVIGSSRTSGTSALASIVDTREVLNAKVSVLAVS